VDYGVSPDGQTVAYAARNENAGSDLYAVSSMGRDNHLLLACPDAACSGPQWLLDGKRLIYERRSLPAPGAPTGNPRLWWLDIGSGNTAPLFEDNQLLGRAARLSPDGQWLSFVAPLALEVQFYNLVDGQTQAYTSHTAEWASWAPVPGQALLTEVALGESSYAVHLLRVDLRDGQLVNLSGPESPDIDSLPAYSPDGLQIAFQRKPAEPLSTKALWLMAADGSQQRQLAGEPGVSYGPPAWSPDGRYLAFERYALAEPGAQPAVWRYDLEAQTASELAPSGAQVSWLP
jgi:TolB protein